MGARISFGEPIVIVDGKKIDSNHIASLEVLKDIDQPDMAAISLSNFGDGGGGGAVRAAAKTTMDLVGTAELLADLDDALCAADCSAALVRHGKSTTSAVGKAIWRGADAKGKANAWLFTLKDERWALLVKLKNRWTVTEGTPDDVLATVPADRFEEAVKAAQPHR